LVAAVGFGLSIALIVGLAFWTLPLHTHIAYSLTFGLLAYSASGGFRWFSTPPMVWMGKISYSAYLWHFALIDLINLMFSKHFDPLRIGDPTNGTLYYLGLLAGIILTTAALSTLTYRFVEQPMIRLGEKLISRRRFAAQPAENAVGAV